MTETQPTIVVKMRSGSHVYGTAVPESDTDYKFVYLPKAFDLLLQRDRPTMNLSSKPAGSSEPNTKDSIDCEGFSLKQYLFMLTQGQTIALDMLFTPDEHILQSSPIWDAVRKHRDNFISRNAAAFVGYCRSQALKYVVKTDRMKAVFRLVEVLKGIPPSLPIKDYTGYLSDEFSDTPTELFSIDSSHMTCCGRSVPLGATIAKAVQLYSAVLSQYGSRITKAVEMGAKDWKSLYHAVRVSCEAEELLTTGHITFPRPEAELLVRIRKGEVPFEEVTELIDKGIERVEAALLSSFLPEKPDVNLAALLVMSTNRKTIFEHYSKGESNE